MPTYDYKCKACGHKFEKFHSMSAASIKKCPVCGKNAVERLIGTGAGLIFRGSGFYITDYRDAAYKDSAKADSGETATKSESGDKAAMGDKAAAGGKTESAPAPAGGDAKSAEPKAAKLESKPPKTDLKPAARHKK